MTPMWAALTATMARIQTRGGSKERLASVPTPASSTTAKEARVGVNSPARNFRSE